MQITTSSRILFDSISGSEITAMCNRNPILEGSDREVGDLLQLGIPNYSDHLQPFIRVSLLQVEIFRPPWPIGIGKKVGLGSASNKGLRVNEAQQLSRDWQLWQTWIFRAACLILLQSFTKETWNKGSSCRVGTVHVKKIDRFDSATGQA